MGFTDEDLEAYKYALSQNGLSGPLNYYRNVLLSSDRPRGVFNTKIKAPTLVVWVSKIMSKPKPPGTSLLPLP